MKNVMWYDKPASEWEKGMPLGNGRLGAMLLGGIQKECIYLNEDTLWSGYPCNYADPEVRTYLEEAREMIFQEEYGRAYRIINQHMVGYWTESYMPMGTLYMEMEGMTEEASRYSRELDLSKGISTTRFTINGTAYTRTVFCSHPAGALIVNIRSEGGGTFSVKASMDSQLQGFTGIEDGQLIMTGWCPSLVEPDYYQCDHPVIYEPFETTRAIKFQVRLAAISENGVTDVTENGISVSNTCNVTLILTASTSFKSYKESPDKDYAKECGNMMDRIRNRDFSSVLQEHIDDFSSLFDRVDIDLGHSDNEIYPTDERLKRMEEGEEDPDLAATVFQFGRYLLISGSREKTQPLNLQGIWNKYLRAPWSSNYTVNINTQMNYWPAEVCNLMECAEPLINFILETADTGRDTAGINYGGRGWTCHHNVDLWRKTTAAGSRKHDVKIAQVAFWPMAAGWLCRHLWSLYEFGGDLKFLRETAYPVMKEAALFLADWLVTNEDGTLCTCPSLSPENKFIFKGEVQSIGISSTMDISIIKELFLNCIKAAELLDSDCGFRELLKGKLEKLPDFSVGKHGQLMEWNQDFEEEDVAHRHLSHLYPLYPSNLISVEETPELARACKVALERRGNGGVSWSFAWKINLWARLREPERAYDVIRQFLRFSGSKEISYTEGGIYENLFCAGPLQVDGNLGFTAGIAEMLLQSQAGELIFLPALPKAWHTGYAKGLKARGNKTVDISWENGKILNVNVR